MIKRRSSLDWRHVPSKALDNALYRDYLLDFGKIGRFFHAAPTPQSIQSKIKTLEATRSYARAELAGALVAHNRALGVPESTLQRLERLRSPKTFAVVTGQQAGLFTGPLYTVYKAITAIQLAAQLEQEMPGYVFVPMFWVAAEDSDLREIDHVSAINAKDEVEEVRAPYGDERRVPKYVPLSAQACAALDSLTAMLPDNDFKPAVARAMRAACAGTAAESFVRSMLAFLGPLGLAFVDPFTVRPFARDVLRRELANGETHAALAEAAGDELQRLGYVKTMTNPDSFNLFVFRGGVRCKLLPKGGAFALKGTDETMTRAELEALIDASPQSVGGNVLVRTIVQEQALPVAASVNGPGEIAYYAQFKQVFEAHGLDMPVLYPRLSATLIEPKIARSIERFGIAEKDLFRIDEKRENILATVAVDKEDPMLGGLAEDARVKIAALADYLKTRFPDRAQKYETFAGRTKTGIDQLLKESAESQRGDQGIGREQLHRVQTHLLPREELQERGFNMVQFACRYGMDLAAQIAQVADTQDFSHQLLYL